MKRAHNKQLTAGELKAAGVSRERVVRKVPPPAQKERGVEPKRRHGDTGPGGG